MGDPKATDPWLQTSPALTLAVSCGENLWMDVLLASFYYFSHFHRCVLSGWLASWRKICATKIQKEKTKDKCRICFAVHKFSTFSGMQTSVTWLGFIMVCTGLSHGILGPVYLSFRGRWMILLTCIFEFAVSSIQYMYLLRYWLWRQIPSILNLPCANIFIHLNFTTSLWDRHHLYCQFFEC